MNTWCEKTVTPGCNTSDERPPLNQVSKENMKVVLFHRRRSPVYATPLMSPYNARL